MAELRLVVVAAVGVAGAAGDAETVCELAALCGWGRVFCDVYDARNVIAILFADASSDDKTTKTTTRKRMFLMKHTTKKWMTTRMWMTPILMTV